MAEEREQFFCDACGASWLSAAAAYHCWLADTREDDDL